GSRGRGGIWGEGGGLCMAGLLEARGLMKRGEELSEQIVQLPLPDQRQVSPRRWYHRDRRRLRWLQGRGGKRASSGGRHAVPPVVSPRRWRHQTASLSNTDTPIVTRIGVAPPPPALGVVWVGEVHRAPPGV